jgi:hypothetical protein
MSRFVGRHYFRRRPLLKLSPVVSLVFAASLVPADEQPSAVLDPGEPASRNEVAYAALVEAIAARVLELLGDREAPQEASPYLSVDEAADLLRAKPQRVYRTLASESRVVDELDHSEVALSDAEERPPMAWFPGVPVNTADRRPVRRDHAGAPRPPLPV